MAKVAIGKKLPKFKFNDTSGDNHDSSALHGKNIVFYFYPRDNTPGCTTEGLDFNKKLSQFKKHNTIIYGISRDTLASHEKFKQKQGFKFELIADPDSKICDLFDVIKEKNMYGKKVMGIERSTFLFDGNGVLRHEWRKVKVPDHVSAVLAMVKELEK